MTADPQRQEPRLCAVDSTSKRPPGARPWAHRLACAGLAVMLGVVYLTMLYPGVSRGDSAELQYMCPLLGICHPPGYAFEVVVGKLFSLLPIGPSVAWRINLMQAVCGVVGCLALYGAVRRLTGWILPGLVASTTLAFSTIYWSHSIVAEVYVFYAAFLLLGIYAAVRFVTGDKGLWLYLAALFLGISVGSRPSEVLVLPALVGLWLGFRNRVRLGLLRIGVSVVLMILPFVFAVGFYMARENPRLLHARDDAVRDLILGLETPFPELPFSQRLRQAVVYSVGAKAAGREDFTAFSFARLRWDLDKYAWLLSGLGAFGDRFPESETQDDALLAFRQREQGRGTSIGALGLLLLLVGLWRWRAQRGAVLLGLGLFFGNLLYYVCVHPVDNLNFTIPGLAGLAVLIGLGASRQTADRPRRWSRVCQLACFAVPAFLLVTNYHIVDPLTPKTREHLELGELVKKTPLPDKAVIIATYWRAHALRCLYWIEAGRTDAHVFVYRERFEGKQLVYLVSALRHSGYTALLSAEGITKTRGVLAERTPRELIDVGLFRPYPLPVEPPLQNGD